MTAATTLLGCWTFLDHDSPHLAVVRNDRLQRAYGLAAAGTPLKSIETVLQSVVDIVDLCRAMVGEV